MHLRLSAPDRPPHPYRARRKNMSLRENTPRTRGNISPISHARAPRRLFRGAAPPEKRLSMRTARPPFSMWPCCPRPRLRCPLCRKPPSAGALAPLVFLCRRTLAARHPARPYRTRRKNTSPRENIPHARGNISLFSHVRTPRRLFRGIRRPRKAALHAHRAPNPFLCGRTVRARRSPRPRGNISPFSHAKTPRRFFGMPAAPEKQPSMRPARPPFSMWPCCPRSHLRCPLCRKPPSAGTLTPLDFLYGRAYPLHDSPAPSPAPL